MPKLRNSMTGSCCLWFSLPECTRADALLCQMFTITYWLRSPFSQLQCPQDLLAQVSFFLTPMPQTGHCCGTIQPNAAALFWERPEDRAVLRLSNSMHSGGWCVTLHNSSDITQGAIPSDHAWSKGFNTAPLMSTQHQPRVVSC